MPTHRLHGLYAITDPYLTPESTLLAQVEAALIGGTQIIQYRDKTRQDTPSRKAQLTALRTLTQRFNAILIINDNPELSQSIQADGVHLGQDDMNIPKARSLLGEEAIIGVTCHGSLKLAERALDQGADYLAFGRFFPSKTKPDALPADLSVLHDFIQHCPIPCVAIGGITLNNAMPLIQAGFAMVAVIQDVFDRQDIENRCRQYQSLFSL